MEVENFALVREALMLTLLISAPILGIGLLVGLVISLLQAVTQVQEQTLAFVPKIVADQVCTPPPCACACLRLRTAARLRLRSACTMTANLWWRCGATHVCSGALEHNDHPQDLVVWIRSKAPRLCP